MGGLCPPKKKKKINQPPKVIFSKKTLSYIHWRTYKITWWQPSHKSSPLPAPQFYQDPLLCSPPLKTWIVPPPHNSSLGYGSGCRSMNKCLAGQGSLWRFASAQLGEISKITLWFTVLFIGLHLVIITSRGACEQNEPFNRFKFVCGPQNVNAQEKWDKWYRGGERWVGLRNFAISVAHFSLTACLLTTVELDINRRCLWVTLGVHLGWHKDFIIFTACDGFH